MLLYLIVQTLYWLALAAWFGGVLFIALAAPVIFRTVRDANPTLAHVLSVNLEGQHSSLLAGTVVANLLGLLARVQTVCAALVFMTLMAQWFVSDVSAPVRLIAAIVRSALLSAVIILLVYDRRVLWPRIWMHRQEYIQHADEPEIANPAKDEFDRCHRESVTLLSIVLFLLLGLVLFGALVAR